MQRKTVIALGVLLLFCSIWGCQRYLPPPEVSPFSGIHIRIACPAAQRALFQVQAAAWIARNGARLEFVEDGVCSTTAIDIRLVPPADLPAYADSSRLLPVPPDLSVRGSPFEWFELLPHYRLNLLTWGGPENPFAVPILGEAPVCLYRVDLFSKPELRQAFKDWQAKQPGGAGALEFEFRSPVTWEHFIVLARFLHQVPAKLSPGGVTPLPEDPEVLARLFYTVAASYARKAVRQDEPEANYQAGDLFSFQYDFATGVPRIAEPGFIEAARTLAEWRKLSRAAAGLSPEEAFLRQTAVLGIADAPALLPMQKDPVLRDKMGISTVPGAGFYYSLQGARVSLKGGTNRVPYLGGSGLLAVVPATSASPDAAFSLLADLAGPVRSAEIDLDPRWDGGPIRVEQVLRDRWDAYELTAPRARDLKEAVGRTLLQHGLRNPALVLRLPDAKKHQEILVQALKRIVKDGADPARELTKVASEWKALDEKAGPGVTRSRYRKSLGLLGNT